MFYDLEDKKVKNLGENWSASNASIIGDVTLEKNTSIWFNATLRGDIEIQNNGYAWYNISLDFNEALQKFLRRFILPCELHQYVEHPECMIYRYVF